MSIFPSPILDQAAVPGIARPAERFTIDQIY
jgi:hypothetical protein